MSAISIAEIVAKRKLRWQERHDIEYDRKLVAAAVQLILSSKELRQEILDKPYLLVEIAFDIVDKQKHTVPFFLNTTQQDFINRLETKGTSRPFFVLKGRQMGFTSLITAMQLAYAIVRKNFSGFTLADTAENARSIFNDKAKVVYERLPELLKPQEKYNSKNELFFDKLNSSWRIAAATAQVGRSKTLNFVHYSEAAFYSCGLGELQAAMGEAIVANAIVVYETTANGFNEAKTLWDSGACENCFYTWWLSEEYRSTEYQYLETSDKWLRDRIDLLYSLGLGKEQVCFYCKKYASYIDKNTIKQEYPCTPQEAFIASGECVFDKESLVNQMLNLGALQTAKKGYFTYNKFATPIKNSAGVAEGVEWHIDNIQFVESQDGYITIHAEPRVQLDNDGEVIGKTPYVIGGDTAGNGIDYFTAKVIDNMTSSTVATLHKQHIDDDLYAEQLYCLGKYYNDALIAVEINYSEQPMKILHQQYHYPKLYMREKISALGGGVEKALGFRTDSKTKPIIISELVTIMRDYPQSEVDMDTLKEMTTFVRKDNGSTEAMSGAHDDLVMALAIAHFASKQQTHSWIAVQPHNAVHDYINKHFSLEDNNNTYIDWSDL